MKKIIKKTATAIIVFFSFSITAPAYANHDDDDGCRNPSGKWGCGGRWDLNRNFTFEDKSYGKWGALGLGILVLGIIGFKALSKNEKPNIIVIEPNENSLEQSKSPVGQKNLKQKVIDTYIRDENGKLRKVSRTDTGDNKNNNDVKIYNTEINENNDGPPEINW